MNKDFLDSIFFRGNQTFYEDDKGGQIVGQVSGQTDDEIEDVTDGNDTDSTNTDDNNESNAMVELLANVAKLTQEITEMKSAKSDKEEVKKPVNNKKLSISEQVALGIAEGLKQHKTNGIVDEIRKYNKDFDSSGFNENGLVQYLDLIKNQIKPNENNRKASNNADTDNGSEWGQSDKDNSMAKLLKNRKEMYKEVK